MHQRRGPCKTEPQYGKQATGCQKGWKETSGGAEKMQENNNADTHKPEWETGQEP